MVEEKLNELEGKLDLLDTALEQKERLLKEKDGIIGKLAEENRKLLGELKESKEACYGDENKELIRQYREK